MLRAVLSEVEAVPSSLSNLREPAVACRHTLELGCGSPEAAVRTVVGARPEVERDVLPGASRGYLSAKVVRAGFGFEERSSGAGSLSTPANVRGLQTSRSKAELACEQSPSRKLQKQRAAQPGHSSGRQPPFQAIRVCERSHFEELWRSAAGRR
jgi:hypothetical protein